MDMYRRHNYNYLQENNNRYVRDRSPSFSSTLLDQIYRSIDETNDHKGTAVKTVKKKKQFIHTSAEAEDEVDFQRIENWMDKRKGIENITKTTSGKSAVIDHMSTRKFGENYGSFVNLNSSWSSSDSSSTGVFSSEAESNYGASSRSSSTTTFRPKPNKASTDIEKNLRDEERDHESEGVVKRSKLKALKIYGDLKKAKQPISPGAKLANFLNSLFTTGGGNIKKGKIPGADSSNSSPACSTYRSCLSKSPGKLSNNGMKRSVRFYPVSVIVDEDCQPCGHKSLQHGHGVKNIAVSDNKKCKNEQPMYHIRRKDQSVEEAARELLKNYQRKVECQMELEDEDDDGDDGASYASSDLFELDNLNNDNYGIDVSGNYMEELPVYETTYLDTNRAIANSLLV
ncbi:protein BIG GRAIN 1-like A [Apium graveolens]|uniref:protein BIG GRAIN 1-like A n=1 Tax=Apium graveolens TaxID=4045 RepID=UPI003D7BD530